MKDKITRILDENPRGIKACDIAKIIGTSKSSINSILYNNMDIYDRDAEYRWYLRDEPDKKEQTPSRDTSKVREINRRLREERRKRKKESEASSETFELPISVIRKLVTDAVIEVLAINGLKCDDTHISQIVDDVLSPDQNTSTDQNKPEQKDNRNTISPVDKELKEIINEKTDSLRKGNLGLLDSEDFFSPVKDILYNINECIDITISTNYSDTYLDDLFEYIDDLKEMSLNKEPLRNELSKGNINYQEYKRMINVLPLISDYLDELFNYISVKQKESLISNRKNSSPVRDDFVSQKPKNKNEDNSIKVVSREDKKLLHGTLIETCRTCNKKFEITIGEIEFYNKLGYNLPTHCKECRKTGIAGIEILTAVARVGRGSNWLHQPNKFVYGK